ncbi:Outer membrane protein beta-barrel domain-containing protein [Bizionia echini]|uniref:Outer membrane protein beta-barrel domain-containing protein n=1 Tax=Bizionia echini TaxID=649333 RepID=A0A1I5DR83_9FLAO|nr:porin family protein [Bizionia echini]SFO01762.1 Outer membrane protein beta-barrel domain-containing protein [Bizionia echini]|tara:strand:+ start:335 stop:865 length:531 start_codon:yes stop_codon:yes gene_type:complete
MKKQLLLIAFVIISAVSYAQNAMYGVRVGYNISNLDFEPDATFDNQHRNGFAIGFFGEYDLSASIGLAPEIQFSAEGAKDRELRVDYIQAPILLKFRIGDRLSLGAGPLVGVKVHEFEDGYRNFSFSGVGALEFMITDEIFIDARYHYGVTNILDDNPVGLEATNTNIQIGIGVKI